MSAKQKASLVSKVAEVAATCACGNLRRASRAVTQHFEAALEPSGLKATQFTLLVAAACAGPAPVSGLAEALVMDRTTLSRNLKPLVGRGLLAMSPGADRRRRLVRLTAKGRRALEGALPLWAGAQARIVAGLGPKRWRGLTDDLGATVALTKER